MAWLVAIIAATAASRLTRLGGDGLVRHMRASSDAVLIVDGNNVRGADCFATSLQELSSALVEWSTSNGITSVLMLDHGVEQRAYRLAPHAVLAFSGPAQTADDLIVRDALWLRKEQQQPVFVVTGDTGLILRTRQYRSKSCASLQVFPSTAFARLLLGDGHDPAVADGPPISRSAHR